MTEMEVKTEEKSEKVVEKRVKPTVIRRRKVKKEAKPEEPKLEAAPEVREEDSPETDVQETQKTAEAQAKTPKKASAKEKEKAPKTAKPVPKVEEEAPKKGLKIIAQPEEVKEMDREKGITPAAPKDAEAKEKDHVRKAARKKKSKAELQFEDIKRRGGLKQYAMGVGGDDPARASVERSRVFEPGRRMRKKKPKKGKKTQITEPKAIKKIIKIDEGIAVSDFSQAMGVKASEIIKKLMGLDIMATMNQIIDLETATLIATEYGYEVEHTAFKEEKFIKKTEKKAAVEENATPRAPVVTVMGHVDHGKTSVLDVIREADVASGEAGGITQHIGAYSVVHNEHKITFVDTPGHEAFTHMRARGAQVTDIVILVVAADDGVMPQTKEAIDHAKAAEVPIIVAVNKIDKPNADPDKVKRELSESELVPEDWGGDTICVPTSAKTKEGIDHLLEMVLLQAEVLELKAVAEGRAEGIVVESMMDKRRGPLITVIVKKGVLKAGESLVSGPASGKARVLLNDKGAKIKEAYPSDAVEILGLSDVPEAGEHFYVVEDEKAAKMIAGNRQKRVRDEQLARRSKVTLEDLKSQIEQGEAKDLNLIVKTDVKGVSDAVKDSLPGLSTKDVKIKVLHTGVGGITEGDVMLAAASGAVILGFNVVPDPAARALAEKESVELKTYSVIYEMLDDVKKAIAGMLAPKEVEKVLGRAEVRDTFKVPKVGIIAGCMVTSGIIKRSAKVRILRENVILHDGPIMSLKRFKDDAKEVASGYECGIGIEKFNDIKVGDELEAYEIEKIASTWEESKG